jgi:hypothetical protein
MKKNEYHRQPTHRVYSATRREDTKAFLLSIGLVFLHKDGEGFNVLLQTIPPEGTIICCLIGIDDEVGNTPS